MTSDPEQILEALKGQADMAHAALVLPDPAARRMAAI